MQDFFKQQAEWLNVWQEQQQKLTKEYASWGEDLAQSLEGATTQQIPTNFDDLLNSQQELFQQFTNFGTNLQQNIQKTWGDKLPEELLRQFNFNLLQEFYKNWLGNMKFPGGMQNPFMGGQNWADPSSFLNNFMKQEHPFFSTFSSNNLTDELQKMFGMFGMLQGSKMPGGDLYSQMFTNFQSIFNQLTNTATSQGFDKLLETFANWKEQTDKYLLAPQVGINRESTQDISKIISLSFSYIQSFATMSKLVEETVRKSGNRFQAKLVERSLNNEPPIKFTDFCSLWTKENEAVFLDVFGTEEFAKTQGEFTGAGMRLKMQMDKLLEKVLVQTPIALKRDVDLAAKEILQLKRDLRQSRRQQQELTTEVKVAQETAAASEQRFQALEAALSKVQVLAENAEQAAKSAVAQQRIMVEKAPAETTKKAPVETTKKAPAEPTKKAPAVTTKKAPAETTKKAPATTTKQATSPLSPKKHRSAKKPAGNVAE
ncbi:MAG: poly(R)-hydroxyalkanoic acid synthase subunit PhaE [Desulfuromonadales bacterium]